jgi:hypothetical protein
MDVLKTTWRLSHLSRAEGLPLRDGVVERPQVRGEGVPGDLR